VVRRDVVGAEKLYANVIAGETMIPEGLEWASAADILDDIRGVGFNYIRM
jgi:hypothetical protein